MAIISKEEVLKIARISAIEIREDEVEKLTKQLEDVLAYAARVAEIAADLQEPSTKNINVFREDVARDADTQAILERAPEREDDFFVVPSIIEDK